MIVQLNNKKLIISFKHTDEVLPSTCKMSKCAHSVFQPATTTCFIKDMESKEVLVEAQVVKHVNDSSNRIYARKAAVSKAFDEYKQKIIQTESLVGDEQVAVNRYLGKLFWDQIWTQMRR